MSRYRVVCADDEHASWLRLRSEQMVRRVAKDTDRYEGKTCAPHRVEEITEGADQ